MLVDSRFNYRMRARNYVAFRLLTLLLDRGIRDRRNITVAATLSIHYLERGATNLMVSYSRDITERKQAEASVKGVQAFLQRVIDMIPADISVKDKDRRYVMVNKHMRDLWGYDMLGKRIRVAPNSARRIKAEDERILRTGEAVPFHEVRLDLQDQPQYWLQTKVPINQEEGAFENILTVAFDITERKQIEDDLRESEARYNAAERNLRESEARFRNLIEGSIQGVMVYRGDQILFANQALAEMYGYSPDELLNDVILSQLDHPSDRERIRQYVEGRLKGKDVPERYEFRGIRKDGTAIWLENFARVVSWDGEPAVQCTIIDITARQMAEERLRQSQKMEAIGSFAGGIAHEFNNLLMVVTGNLELLRDKLPAGSAPERWINTALQGATRGADLTQSLLAFARERPLNPRPTDLNELVDGVIDMSRKMLGPGIGVAVETSEALWLASTDRTQLDTAVLNLLINARDAMPAGGKITITTSNVTLSDEAAVKLPDDILAGDYVRLAVKDCGTGMPNEVAERAFEPFYTTKEVGKGTGLGLSMVYGFVRQMGGTAELATAPGEGTTVFLYLPRDSSVVFDEPKTVTPAVEATEASATVLVVDDNPEVLQTIAELIEALGHRALRATSGETALEMLATGTEIDLLFTDIVMGGISGWHLAEEVRVQYPDLKVLLTSARGLDIGETAVSDRPYALLKKPYGKNDLRNRIQDILAVEQAPDYNHSL